MLRVFRRLAYAVFLAAFLGQLTGFVPSPESQACAEDCPGEEEFSDDCSDSCRLCACCPALRLVTSALSVRVLPQLLSDVVDWSRHDVRPSPDPREIFHVPRCRHS
jgi:hypothetical protein